MSANRRPARTRSSPREFPAWWPRSKIPIRRSPGRDTQDFAPPEYPSMSDFALPKPPTFTLDISAVFAMDVRT